MRVIKPVFIIVFVLLLVVMGITAYTVTSEHGLKQALKLSQKFVPGTLKWEDANGTLLGPLSIRALSYLQDDGLSFSVDQLNFDWSEELLLSSIIQIERLQLSHIEVHLPKPVEKKSDDQQQDISLPQVSLPFSVKIVDLNLQEINIYTHGAKEPLAADSLFFSGDIAGQSTTINTLDLRSPDIDLSVIGKLNTIDAYPMDFNLSWNFRSPDYGNFRGHGHSQGDLNELVFTHQVEGPVELEIKTYLFDLLNSPSWNGELMIVAESLEFISSQLSNSPLQAQITTHGSLDDFQSEGHIDSELSETGPLALAFDLSGNLENIQFTSALLEVIETNSKIEFSGTMEIETTRVDLQGQWKSLRWPITGELVSIESPEGAFQLQGSHKNFETSITSKIILENRDFNTSISVTGMDNNLTLTNLSILEKNSELSVKATADFNITKKTFSSNANWNALSWPTEVNPQIYLSSGALSAGGDFNNYKFNLQSDISGESIPKGQWNLAGLGNDRQLHNFILSGDVLEGKISANGAAQWSPDVEWSGTLTGKEVNPASISAQVDGDLNFNIDYSGKIQGENRQLNARINNLQGTLRKQDIKGAGAVEVINDDITVDNFSLSLADSFATASGTLGDELNLKWKVESPDLSIILVDLAGSTSGQGLVTGTLSEPRVTANVDVNNLKFADTSLEKLSTSFNINLSNNTQSFLDLSGRKLTSAGQMIDTVFLKGEGTPSKHKAILQLDSALAKLGATIQGSLDKNQSSWSGKLSKLSLKDTEVGDWIQLNPVTLLAEKDNAHIDKLCLTSTPSELCAEAQWSVDTGSNAKLQIIELNVDRFKNYFPDGLKTNLSASANATASLGKSGEISAVSTMDISPGSIFLGEKEDTLQIKLTKGSINSSLEKDSAISSVNLEFEKLGHLASNIRIKQFSEPKPTLSGTLVSKINDLTGISVLLPELQEIAGHIETDLEVSGPLEKPDISGTFELSDFSAEIPDVAIKLQDTHFKASGEKASPLVIDAKAHSGKGSLTLAGKLNPSSGELDLALTGDSFQVANSDKIQADVSPNLNIAMNGEGMAITGKITIPKAYVNARSGNDELKTIGNSKDVVFTQEGGQLPPDQTNSNLNVDVNIILGEDIKIEAGDFRGVLQGQLQVVQTPELAASGTGTIEVVNGEYVLYGQQLNIKKGKILFAGGPVDNPKLDLDVARDVPAYEVTAGAKIMGTAQAPILQLYADPSMPDASILSFILLGQPPGTTAGSYAIGKNLTPDLYVSYGIGLFNAANTFNMKYKLTERFALQAASSTADSADLIYTIEK